MSFTQIRGVDAVSRCLQEACLLVSEQLSAPSRRPATFPGMVPMAHYL